MPLAVSSRKCNILDPFKFGIALLIVLESQHLRRQQYFGISVHREDSEEAVILESKSRKYRAFQVRERAITTNHETRDESGGE